MNEQEHRRLRTAFLPTRDPATYEPDPPPDVPFTLPELRRVYSQSHSSTAEKWVAYTDGSVVHQDGLAMGSFAGMFTQGPDTRMEFRGRVVEQPMSSTRMEIMAILVVIAITPSATPLEVHTDSQAAAHMMLRVAAPTIPRELANSPDAFLWLHLRGWLQSRQAPVSAMWIRGHSGVAGNVRADELARSAHSDSSVTRWTTRTPPPPDTPFWPKYDDRAIPRRLRRLFREQDEAITSSQLIKQVNAVPHRPRQSPKEVEHILHILRWTVLPNGQTAKKKCWNITNIRDSNIRAFGLKQLMGFLPTLARQEAWYPNVYDRPELIRCAKCSQPGETQEHLYECADHLAVKESFQARFCTIESSRDKTCRQADMRMLRPWNSMGWLQGRIHPRWALMIPSLQHDRLMTVGTPTAIQRLLRSSLETWYHTIWLPRCQRTISQEKSQGLHQGAKLRRMRVTQHRRPDAPASPAPNLPLFFLESSKERMDEYHRLMLRLMHGAL